MTVRVGVIGVGMIGQEHIRRITEVLSGGTVVAVTDVDADRAAQVAAGLRGAPGGSGGPGGPGVTVHATGRDLIADGNVDAVLVTSWGATHEEHVLAAIEAGKPVFCEKPLATTQEACLRIIDAEMAAGRRLVQVGFMRRYDDGYRALKQALDSGQIGAPLLMHCAHRNPAAPPYGFTTELIINDSAVHEIDLVRWMFDEDIVAASVLTPRPASQAGEGLQDPLIVLLQMASGILVDVEVFVNARYGYDIRGEIVGENGTVALADGAGPTVKQDGRRASRVPGDWRERFGRAFDTEFQDWLAAVTAGTATGPSSWDGYAAAVATDACLEALRTGQRVAVSLPERPGFYTKTQ
jgi:myo-inositol 2-dehydrogenase / D-chiro-inositol 1-dehydrogenase